MIGDFKWNSSEHVTNNVRFNVRMSVSSGGTGSFVIYDYTAAGNINLTGANQPLTTTTTSPGEYSSDVVTLVNGRYYESRIYVNNSAYIITCGGADLIVQK